MAPSWAGGWQGRVEDGNGRPVGPVTRQVGWVGKPKDEAVARPPPGTECRRSLHLTGPSSVRSHTVSLRAASEGRKEEEPSPTGQGQSFQHTSVRPPRSPVDPTVSHTWVAAAGPRAGGWRLMGGHGAGRRPGHPLLFTVLVSIRSWNRGRKPQKGGVEVGSGRGTVPLWADGSPAPVLS